MKRPLDSGPPAPVAMPISDVPVAPVALSFVSGPPAPLAPRKAGARLPALRQSVGWAVDLALLGALAALHLLVAARVAGPGHAIGEVLLAAPAHWAALGGALALAGSWLSVSLFGRTPGMALTGQRLRRTKGGSPDPLTAFCRAALAVLSASLGLFGFVVALFDRRGRTLHDKLCGCVCVVD
jgi:resuscitation-promoting factor RpfA